MGIDENEREKEIPRSCDTFALIVEREEATIDRPGSSWFRKVITGSGLMILEE